MVVIYEKYIYNFKKEEGEVSFAVEGVEGAQITLGLEPEAEYEIIVDNEPAGVMSTNLGGKLSLSVEVETENKVAISVKRR